VHDRSAKEWVAHTGYDEFSLADPLLFDEQLSEEERMVRDTAAYAQEKLAGGSLMRSPIK
jgi:hypothetical protein